MNCSQSDGKTASNAAKLFQIPRSRPTLNNKTVPKTFLTEEKERGTQVEPVLKMNATTQTTSASEANICCLKEVVMQALGAQKQIISKGCDDAVLCCPRFLTLLFNKREKWIQFMLEVDFKSKRSGAEVFVALPNEAEPTTFCKGEILKDIEFKEESINLNWKEDLSSYSIKTQDNLIIERDREDEISLGVEELLTPSNKVDFGDMRDQGDKITHMELLDPSNKVDVGDMRDQGDKITHMELLDPSTELGVDVTLHGNSLQHEFSKRRKIELDPPLDTVWKMKDSHLLNEEKENENHSQSPKRIESNIESVLFQIKIDQDAEIMDKSTHLNLNENPPMSRGQNLKRASDFTTNDELRRTFIKNKYPFLKECFVNVKRLSRQLAASDIPKSVAVNVMNNRDDREIKDEPIDLNLTYDPHNSSEPNPEREFKIPEEPKELMETLSRKTIQGLESRCSIRPNDVRPSSERIRLTGIGYASNETANLTSNMKSVHKKIKPFTCLEISAFNDLVEAEYNAIKSTSALRLPRKSCSSHSRLGQFLDKNRVSDGPFNDLVGAEHNSVKSTSALSHASGLQCTEIISTESIQDCPESTIHEKRKIMKPMSFSYSSDESLDDSVADTDFVFSDSLSDEEKRKNQTNVTCISRENNSRITKSKFVKKSVADLDSLISDNSVKSKPQNLLIKNTTNTDLNSENKFEQKENLLKLLAETIKKTYQDKLKIGERLFDYKYSYLRQNQNPSFIKICKPVALGRVYDSRNACFFCEVPQSKISRHITREHTDETVVAAINDLQPGNSQRQEQLDLLRCAGNFKHNIKVLNEKKGELLVARRPSTSVGNKCPKISEYIPCLFCLGFFNTKQISKHIQLCRYRPKDETPKNTSYINRGYNVISIALGNNNEAYTQMVANMINDPIKSIVENDKVIMSYGSMLITKKGVGQKRSISNKMRELARIVIECNNIAKKKQELSDYINIAGHEILLKAALNLTHDSSSKIKKPLSLGIRVGHSLKEVSDLLLVNAIIEGNPILKQHLKDFNYLMQKKWSNELSVPKMRELMNQKAKKIPLLPETEDLVILSNAIKANLPLYIATLRAEKNFSNWSKLAKITLGGLIMFNKRREGETSKMLLSDYTMRPDYKSLQTKEIFDSLSSTEKVLSRTLEMFQVLGKRGRQVPVLLTPALKLSIDVLCETRSEVGVLQTNVYLFANSSQNFIRGSEAITQCLNLCAIKNPEKIRSTALRKYVCTVSQVMQLGESDIQFLVRHLGHDLKTHLHYYRLHHSTIEMTKVAKILIAVDEGIMHKLKGKNLDDVSLNMLLTELGNDDKSAEEINHSAQSLDVGGGQLEISDTNVNLQDDENVEISALSEIPVVQESPEPESKTEYTKWPKELKEKAFKTFAKNISDKKAPGKAECSAFLANNNITNRTWQHVKALIYNSFK